MTANHGPTFQGSESGLTESSSCDKSRGLPGAAWVAELTTGQGARAVTGEGSEPAVEHRAVGPAGEAGRVGGDEPKNKAAMSPWPNKGCLGILVERKSHP